MYTAEAAKAMVTIHCRGRTVGDLWSSAATPAVADLRLHNREASIPGGAGSLSRYRPTGLRAHHPRPAGPVRISWGTKATRAETASDQGARRTWWPSPRGPPEQGGYS